MIDKQRHTVEIGAVLKGKFDDIIDVRSPSEFEEDHVPGAINCPVLDDAQRAEVGTIYKQVSPFEARKIGAAMASRNIAEAIDTKFSDKEKGWKPLVYCWRGGQRSGSMYTVLREVGWNAFLLKGGYKAYRSHVLEQLKELPKRFKYVVIGGPTGSGKTLLLGILEKQGAQVLDLEGMARHRGSVLGFDPEHPKQSQKSFDTQLAEKLSGFDKKRPVFVECESRRIGIIHLPEALYEGKARGAIAALDIPLKERIAYLSEEYVWFKENPEKLKAKLAALKEIRGKKTIERWFEMIDEGQWDALIGELLELHYDPLYASSSRKECKADVARHVFPARTIGERSFKKLAKEIIGQLGG